MAVMIALCAVVSVACAVMLFRGFSRTGTAPLFWTAMCFAGFALENSFLFLDLVVLPEQDLATLRYLPAMSGVLCLGIGFWQKEPG